MGEAEAEALSVLHAQQIALSYLYLGWKRDISVSYVYEPMKETACSVVVNCMCVRGQT